SQDAFARPLATRDDWLRWLSDWESNRLPFLASFAHPELIDYLKHPGYDDFWAEIDVSTWYDAIDVPIFHECGWYDRYIRWTFQNFVGITEHGGLGAKDSQRLLIGPWVHGGEVAPEAGPTRFGPNARHDRVELMIAWFDRWLKGAGDSR